MVSFRKIAVFIALAVGLMFGLASVADAAHTKSHRARAKPRGEGVEMTGRRGKPEMILQGPVASVSPATGFIVIRHGAGKNAEEIPVEVDSKTTLTRAGRSANIGDIKAGDRVRIHYSGRAGDVTKVVDVTGGPSMRGGARRATKRSM